MIMADRPRVFDTKRGAVIVTWNSRQSGQLRTRTAQAQNQVRPHEYIEGWLEGRDHGLDRRSENEVTFRSGN